MDEAPLYSSLILKTYVSYLKFAYPDIDVQKILDYTGITNYEIEDAGHWVTQTHVNRFNEFITRETNNSGIARQAGRFNSSPKAWGYAPLRQTMGVFISPVIAYWAVDKLTSILNRSELTKSNKLTDNSIEITSTPLPGVHQRSFQCENRMGMYEAIGQVLTGKYATVEHPECIHNGGDCCRYIVSWDSPKSMLYKKIGYYALGGSALASILFIIALPSSIWAEASLAVFLISTLILLFSANKRILEISENLKQQSDVSNEVLNQINLRYNESLLIREIGEAISNILDPIKLLNFIADALHKRLLFNRSVVMLANADKTRLAFAAGAGYTQEEKDILDGMSFSLTNPNSKGYFYQAFVQQKPFLWDDTQYTAADLSEKSYALIEKMGIKSFICVPIVFRGKSEGILAVDVSNTKNKTTQSEVSLLVGIAQQIGISLNNARMYKNLLDSEERFRNLSNNSPDIVYQLDQAGRIKFINTAWEALLGHSKIGAEGKYLSDYLKPSDKKIYTDTVEDVLSYQVKVKDKNFTILNAKGSPHRITLSAVPDLDSEGSVVGVVGTIRDNSVTIQ